MLLEIFLGIIAAILLILLYKKILPGKVYGIWGSGLIIAALIYVIFALVAKNWEWLPWELGGLVLYTIPVILSRKISPVFLAIGWLLHVLWDVLLHSGGHPGYVPSWYPGACLGFDIVIGVYVFWYYWQRR